MIEGFLYLYVLGAVAMSIYKLPRDLTIAEHATAVFLWPVVLVGVFAIGLYRLALRARTPRREDVV